MCVYSEKAADYDKGFDVDPVTKQARPRKVGAWVMTLEECDMLLEERYEHEGSPF